MKTLIKFTILAALLTTIVIPVNANFGQETLTFDSGSESVKHQLITVSFNETFSNTPVVFAEPITENGGQAVQPVIDNVTTTTFDLRIEEDRGRGGPWLNGSHVFETVDWIAFDPTEITAGEGIEAGTSNFYQSSYAYTETVSVTETYASAPLVFAQLNTNNGGHVSRPDLTSISTTSFDVRDEEDPGNGAPGGWDGRHVAEDIAYLALDSALDLSDSGMYFDSESVTESWATVCYLGDCSDAYVDVPSVFVEIQSENEADTVQADLDNVGVASFDVRLEEQILGGWDNTHVAEDVAWLSYGEPVAPAFDPADYSAWVVDTDSSGDTLIRDILSAQGYNVTFLDSSYVETDLDNTYDLLVWPGGVDPVTDAITNTTLQGVVKEYMDAGGNYIGVCGGGIAGSETVYLMDYPYLPFDMTLDTFGTGEGVNADYDYDWTSYIGAAIYPDVEVATDHDIFDGYYGAGDLFSITYAGGPVYNGSGYTSLATYTADIDGYPATGEDAIVETEYTTDYNGDGDSESGGVILFGVHPEFMGGTEFLLENSAEYLLSD
jgi:glutamine amidotransferase-like uncharacterized protein